jgi:fructuronate reductase
MEGTLPRLSNATLPGARPGTRRPAYDRSALRPGLLHLGVGAFARAHLCNFTEDVLDGEAGPWGIVGASLKRPDQRDRLAPQDFLYTAIERDGAGDRARILGCLVDVLVAPEDPARLLRAMADPAIRIVSLTITEKGYDHDPATGRLDAAHPEIRHDLDQPGRPVSAVGFLVEALRLRRDAGAAPFTVLCCDNLPANGRVVSQLVLDMAALRDDALAAWIERHGAFPSTMVDGIVPAATDDDRALASRLTGLDDAAPVVHEPFRQLVMEDRFVDGVRPPWERAGVEIAGDVVPYEHMKLRLLNGAHSALAYLGYLAGHETIVDTMRDPVFVGYVDRLWREEIIPEVAPPPGVDLAAHVGRLRQRFSNPAIRHRTWQIAMDGSQKLPQRLLRTVRERLRDGRPIDRLALAVAAWIRYVGAVDEQGRAIDVRDPLAPLLKRTIDEAGPRAAVPAVLALQTVFGTDLGREPRFVQPVADAYARLLAKGSRAAVGAL